MLDPMLFWLQFVYELFLCGILLQQVNSVLTKLATAQSMDCIDKLYENHIQEFLKKLKVSGNPEVSSLSPRPLWYVISYAIAVVTRGGRTGIPDHYAHSTFLDQRNLLMPLIVLQVLSI